MMIGQGSTCMGKKIEKICYHKWLLTWFVIDL